MNNDTINNSEGYLFDIVAEGDTMLFIV